MNDQICPECKLINHETALYCDCGYNFKTGGEIQQDHPGALQPKKKSRLIIAVDASSLVIAPSLMKIFGLGGGIPALVFDE